MRSPKPDKKAAFRASDTRSATVKLECQLIFADGTSIDAQADVSSSGHLLDQSSELHWNARELAIELLDQHPESIAVLFGVLDESLEEEKSALLFPRPDCPAARDFVVALREDAVKSGTAIVSRRLDS
jgi:uncharacterized Fe-S cluster-containing protein